LVDGLGTNSHLFFLFSTNSVGRILSGGYRVKPRDLSSMKTKFHGFNLGREEISCSFDTNPQRDF
jgi:hypothetical protein